MVSIGNKFWVFIQLKNRRVFGHGFRLLSIRSAFSLVGGWGICSRAAMKASSDSSWEVLSFWANLLRSLNWGLWEWEDFFCLCSERTERLGLVGLTQVDFGLDKNWVWWSFREEEESDKVVAVRGLSCSEREELFCFWDSDFGGEFEEVVQDMVSDFLLGNNCVSLGEVKKMTRFESECLVKWTSRGVEIAGLAIREGDERKEEWVREQSVGFLVQSKYLTAQVMFQYGYLRWTLS